MVSGRETVFETEWFSVERESFDGIASLDGKPYYRLNSPDGVMVLALTEASEIIMVRQFRPALGQDTLELPCGFVDGSETPEQAAARELYEETGYSCPDLARLGTGRIMANRTPAQQFAFFGTGAVLDENFRRREDIDVVLASGSRFKALVVAGEFQQLSALGLLVLADWRLGRQLVRE